MRRFAGHVAHVERLEAPLRIAHVTDLHVGLVTPLSAQRAAVAAANASGAELVVLTGDYVCFSQRFLPQLIELVAGFDAPVVATLGNHDHWCGASEVTAALREGGATVLSNETHVVEIAGRVLQVVGIDDAFTGHADAERALRGFDPGLPSVGLSHVGEEAPALWRAGVPLVLSGHTHAGQITLASFDRLLMNRVMGHSFVHGLYGSRHDPTPAGALYVGAGIGAPRIPFRFGERGRREVTVFDLGIAPGSFEEHHVEQAELPGRPPYDWQTERRRGIIDRERKRRDRIEALRRFVRRD